MSSLLSLTGAKWREAQIDNQQAENFARVLGLGRLTARCAAARWHEPPELQLNEHCLHDPFSMEGMDRAIERLHKAIRRQERVRIITDYDVDGTTSSLILQSALGLCGQGITIDYHIPNRFDEGYGFSPKSAHKAVNDGIDLIITADIGIRDHESVQIAHEGGVDVLICDHHITSGDSVPEQAIVLCPPQASCAYPNPHLAACGVSFKLAQALLRTHPKRELILKSMMKLVAIGTVADLVPMTSAENRALVHMGLEQLNIAPHTPGLEALLSVSGVERGQVRTYDLGYRLGPRINAAGRLADASMIIRLLTCRDQSAAGRMAAQLDALNTERKGVQDRITKAAMEQVGNAPPSAVVVAGPEPDGWHRGVVGIVASRLKEEYHRPCAVLSIQGELAVGSMRSIDAIHAVECLESARDLLVRFGGHPKAAGFTVKTIHIDELRSRMNQFVEERTNRESLVLTRHYDCEVQPEEVSDQTRRELLQLGPFGMGNPQPRLLLRNVQALDIQIRGKTGSLVKFQPGETLRGVEAIWWGQRDHAPVLQASPVDLIGSLGINRWKGRETLQFNIEDARIASS